MGGLSILVVEDEALVRMVTTDTLEAMGCTVEAAASATEAIDRVRALEGRIDAAILDLGLPDRRGDVLAGELRAMHGSLPILIATGYTRADATESFKNDKLVGFLSKPYDGVQIETALRALGIAMKANV